MAITIQQIYPVAHLPLVLGVLRRLEVATLIDGLIPPHPAHGLSCGRGVEALVLAILDGHHALYKVGKRLEERGMVTLLQPGLTRAALNPTFKGSESPFRFFVLRALHTTRRRGPAHHRAAGDGLAHHTSARPADQLSLIES
jgi:Domain of unknown function (DUF4277)